MKFQLLALIISLMFGHLCISQDKNTSELSKSNAVGFITFKEVDKSRPSITDSILSRIVQINIWYPAQVKQESSHMLFSDFLRIKEKEMSIGETHQNFAETINNYFQWPISQGADKALIDSITSVKIAMKSLTNAGFAPGKFPLILLMHGSAVDFAFLGESLAEQGYIVLNVPIKGYSQKEIEVNGIGMETEIRDFEFALSIIANKPNVDLSNIVALGFSFGGQSALGLACRNPNIKKVISYDGGIGDKFGARLITESPFCGTENITASILHLYDASYRQNYLDKMRSFVHAERTFVGLNRIAHWHFTSFGYLASQVPNLFGKQKFAENGYETILGITKGYLSLKSKNPNAQFELSKDKFELVQNVENHIPIKTR